MTRRLPPACCRADRALSDAFHLRAQEGTHRLGSRGGRRNRTADRPDGRHDRRAGDRHGRFGGQGQARLGDGASDAILYNSQDFVAESEALTGGQGVEVVYDGVGQATFLKGFDCLKPRGMMVIFGNASGPAPFDALLLSQKGSLYVTRPTLFTYMASREDLEWRSSDLFRWIGEGKVKINIDKIYPLAEAAQAQRDIEGRKTTGKLLLKVS